ncbi:CheR family methyltransferase [Brevibacillus agri]|uniref:CheR family methyltransferase n=1 Tax=Brevibacillus agri TaxID=51101 RepID=UPI000470967F|nr:protein-glutamate O-methyltransferase CheR [Brevibacillus agri]MED4572073.1 protein-glutamate O-methyltransferase CheR [Brevibacillus agri]WHX32508.1 protein-glutamate O-methyltransferase CheR [Brevibacillus agri]
MNMEFKNEIRDNDMCLNDLAQMIYDFCGLNYLGNLSSLASKVSKRLSVLNMSYWEYTEFLKRNQQEWNNLVELITNNETYFFREESQLNELRDAVLPQLRNKECIWIWSAACSTGEEPYSLAMTIAESGIVPLESVRIIATDINKKVLQIARRGWYHKNSLCFRRTPKEMLDKYFIPQDEGFHIKSFIKDRVEFRYANLLDDEDMAAVEKVDIIFCRNVLIYFDSVTTRRVVAKFYDRLNSGGFLFLGHAETITGMNINFATINARAAFYYQKADVESSPF